jgi:hypothetical protein
MVLSWCCLAVLAAVLRRGVLLQLHMAGRAARVRCPTLNPMPLSHAAFHLSVTELASRSGLPQAALLELVGRYPALAAISTQGEQRRGGWVLCRLTVFTLPVVRVATCTQTPSRCMHPQCPLQAY